MKRKYNIKALLVLIAISLTLCAVTFIQPKAEVSAGVIESKGVINVYLIAGQSNAVGYGQDTNSILAGSDARFTNGFDNVLYYDNNERYGEGLVDGFQSVKLGLGKDSACSGAEIGIASAIANNGEMNAVIKCAWGATHLYPDTVNNISYQQGTWTSPSYIANKNVDTTVNPQIGEMYRKFLRTVVDGLNMLENAGYEPIIRGLWWMQGEAEMFTLQMSSAYAELLRTLIADMRSDLSKITGADLSQMPFVFGLPTWNATHAGAPAFEADVRSAMKMVAADSNLVNVDAIDCKGLTQHDSWHFDAKSQKYLGEQFISKLSVLKEGYCVNIDEGISMMKSVEIRDNEPIGLRFGAKISNYKPENGYSYGMIILPTDYLSKYALVGDYVASLNRLGVDFIDLSCNVLSGDYNGDGIIENYVQGSIVDLKYKNLNRSFTAIAYIKNEEGEYLYSSSTVNESLARLASQELVQKGESATHYAELVKYVNGAVNYELGISEDNGYAEANFVLEAPELLTVDYADNQSSKQIEVKQIPEMDFYVEYSSDNEDVATVDSNGNVFGISAGETIIRVKCLNIEKEIRVSVEYPEIDGLTVDACRDKTYGDAIEKTILSGDRWYSVSAVKTESGVFIYTEGLFDKAVSAGSGQAWYASTNYEFKLNGGKQSYVNIKGESAGVTSFVYKAEQVEADKYLHKVEIYIAKELINGWGESVQLNYAWKTPEEKAYMLSDMIEHRYVDWNTDWHSYHRLGGLSADYSPMKANLFIGNAGLVSVGGLSDGINIDGVIVEGEYGTNYVAKTTANLEVTLRGKVVNDNAYLAFEIIHSSWSVYNNTPGNWWQNDNIEIIINDVNATVLFLNGSMIIPSTVALGACTTITNEQGKLVTTVELAICGNSEQYKLKIGMNGASFAWADICWSQAFGYLTADGVYYKQPMTVGNALLDGELTEDIWTEAVMQNNVSTTANGANITIMGTKDEKGVYLAVRVNHSVAPNVSLDGSNQWHTFMNIEFRLNGSDSQIMATCRNESAAPQSYAYCETIENDGEFISTFEIFVPYSVIGASAEQEQISLRANGWFESGWIWLFGGQNWNATHRLTVDGIF